MLGIKILEVYAIGAACLLSRDCHVAWDESAGQVATERLQVSSIVIQMYLVVCGQQTPTHIDMTSHQSQEYLGVETFSTS